MTGATKNIDAVLLEYVDTVGHPARRIIVVKCLVGYPAQISFSSEQSPKRQC